MNKTMNKQNIDRLEAKREFLLNYSISLKDVANKYGLSYSKIKKISAKREWYKDKREVQKIISNSLLKENMFNVIQQHRSNVKSWNKYRV